MPKLLSLHTTTTEPEHPRAHALEQEKPPQWEARILKAESSPLQLEKAQVYKEDPAQPKINKLKRKKKLKNYVLKKYVILLLCKQQKIWIL